jgi:hypothetical protein
VPIGRSAQIPHHRRQERLRLPICATDPIGIIARGSGGEVIHVSAFPPSVQRALVAGARNQENPWGWDWSHCYYYCYLLLKIRAPPPPPPRCPGARAPRAPRFCTLCIPRAPRAALSPRACRRARRAPPSSALARAHPPPSSSRWLPPSSPVCSA